MNFVPHKCVCHGRNRQLGAALLLSLTLMGLLVAIFVVILTNDLVRENYRRQLTTIALAKAKEALIGFAASVNLSGACGSPTNNCVRPGDLPCPDLNDNGEADDGACSDASSGNQEKRIGRLPWKTLGLPDLRDGNGERLWYAVSNNFQNSVRTICLTPGDAGCLNSETPGTITVSDRNGVVIHDGQDPNPPSGLVAIIIAPGPALVRDDTGSTQDRSCSGGSCDAQGVCTSSPASLTAKCNPVNYLDVVSGGEDNANFTDGSSYDGFINGPILAAGNNSVLVNDTLLPIKYEDVMPLLERRVAKEALNCISNYGAVNKRFPWAAGITESASSSTYQSKAGERFGRIPDSFGITLLDTVSLTDPFLASLLSPICSAPLTAGLCATPTWATVPACNIPNGGWWRNWKDQVFYATSAANKPLVSVDLFPTLQIGFSIEASCAPTGNCMTVNPTAGADKRAVVIVAGRPLASTTPPQPQKTYVDPPAPPTASVRNRANAQHYLEGINAGPASTPAAPSNFTFQQSPWSTTFNDTVLYQ
ncbi:MAG TPA: hypothetical protein VHA15_14635 [Burkholderiales bacterium]|nr:hypothetical protein [Burkholderiales bacterium]